MARGGLTVGKEGEFVDDGLGPAIFLELIFGDGQVPFALYGCRGRRSFGRLRTTWICRGEALGGYARIDGRGPVCRSLFSL